MKRRMELAGFHMFHAFVKIYSGLDLEEGKVGFGLESGSKIYPKRTRHQGRQKHCPYIGVLAFELPLD